MVPLDVFRSQQVAVALAAAFMGMVGFYGVVFVRSLYLQQVHHQSALTTGLLFLPMTALVAALNPPLRAWQQGSGTAPRSLAGSC